MIILVQKRERIFADHKGLHCTGLQNIISDQMKGAAKHGDGTLWIRGAQQLPVYT